MTAPVVRLVIVSSRGPASLAGGVAVVLRSVCDQRMMRWRSLDEMAATFDPGQLAHHRAYGDGRLWPMLHDLPTHIDVGHESRRAYVAVCRQLAQQLAAELAPDDHLWIHDYQLLPLGAALRRAGARQRLGFFLHTPFPPLHALLALTEWRQIVADLCGYDSIGFQTAGDCAAFAAACHHAGQSRAVRRAFAAAVAVDAVALRSSVAKTRPMQPHRIIGIDRLDYTKGLPDRVSAIARAIARNFAWHYLQVMPPARLERPAYPALAQELTRLADRSNTHLGRQAIQLHNVALPHQSVLTLLAGARVCCVTPLRDGMNLVAKEFVAVQDAADPGVLILSRGAGAARELDAAVLVEPGQPASLDAALARALTMGSAERRNRHAALFAAVCRHGLNDWLNTCTTALEQTVTEPQRQASVTTPLPAVTAPMAA